MHTEQGCLCHSRWYRQSCLLIWFNSTILVTDALAAMVEHADHILPSAPVLMTWRQQHLRFQPSQGYTVKTLSQKQRASYQTQLDGQQSCWILGTSVSEVTTCRRGAGPFSFVGTHPLHHIFTTLGARKASKCFSCLYNWTGFLGAKYRALITGGSPWTHSIAFSWWESKRA